MNTQPRNKRVVFAMGGKGGVGKSGLMVTMAALVLGFFLGTWFASVREVAPTTPGTVTLQKMPIETSPQSQVMPQRRKDRH